MVGRVTFFLLSSRFQTIKNMKVYTYMIVNSIFLRGVGAQWNSTIVELMKFNIFISIFIHFDGEIHMYTRSSNEQWATSINDKSLSSRTAKRAQTMANIAIFRAQREIIHYSLTNEACKIPAAFMSL